MAALHITLAGWRFENVKNSHIITLLFCVGIFVLHVAMYLTLLLLFLTKNVLLVLQVRHSGDVAKLRVHTFTSTFGSTNCIFRVFFSDSDTACGGGLDNGTIH